MAQSGFTPIQLYRSTTPTAVPLAADLVAGELALNLADEKLYFENASGVVKVLADSTYVGTVTSVNASGGTTGLSFSGGPITSSGTLTLAGTLAVANGGTGVTTSTGTGSVVLSASPSFTGTVNFGPSIVTGTGVSTGDAQLELGGNRSGDGPAYMDLHAVAGGDFNARVFRQGGANGSMEIVNTGTGVLSIATNATEKMRINASGNVGIGVTSPPQLLAVGNATDQVGAGVSGAVSTVYFGSPSTGSGGIRRLAYDRATGNFDFIGNSVASPTTQMTITAAGNVGIGTTSPAARLHLAGTAVGATLRLENQTASTGKTYDIISGDSGPLRFQDITAGAERMRIDSSGNVMVGTTSATGLFSVAGVSYGQMIATDRFGILGNNLYFGGGGGGDFRYIGNGHAYGWTQGNTDGADYRLLYAGNNTSGAGAVATTSERIYITSAGNVGIGTSSPAVKLDVIGAIYSRPGGAAGAVAELTADASSGANGISLIAGFTSGGYGPIKLLTSATERMRIASNGFVGVGTSTDNGIDKLTVAGIVGSYVSGRAGFHLYNGGATAEWFIGQPSAASHNLTFSKLVSSTYTDYVAIDSSGNVGIGNTSPTVTLDVTGGIKTSRTAVTSPATSDGNIFSGTYTPTLTNVANIDIPASTAYTFQYMRVGNVVTVSGKIDVTVTGTGLTRLNVSLPISSNFSAEENCAGTAVMTASGVSINIPASIRADTTNDVAEMRYWGNLTGSAQAYLLTFTYRVI
jgi:hypothetical protein